MFKGYRKKNLLFLFLMLSCVTFLLISHNNTAYQANLSYLSKFNSSQQLPSFILVPHTPISVENDEELNSVSIGGTGTKENPFILEGWNITSNTDHGIYISNTTAFFELRNCWIKTEGISTNGIYLKDIAFGTASILNNTLVNNFYSIAVDNTDSMVISNNTCTNSEYGIYVFQSSYVVITSNIISYIEQSSITLQLSDSCVIAKNVCENSYYGLSFTSSSTNITNNTVQNNNIGLYLFGDYCHIINNSFIENDGYAIKLLIISENNQIHHNNFINNSLVEIHPSQAEDKSFSNVWSEEITREGNYWSDYNGNISYPGYKIDGPVAVDECPLNDQDNDGMPDWWEYTYEIDVSTDDASTDEEPDGLTNIQEYQYRTDPKNNDTDGDGIPDGAEILYGLNPLLDDADLDYDGDGLSNLDEYENHSDINNPDTDGDGFSDYEEVILHGTDPNDPKDNRRRDILRNIAIIVPILILGGIAGVFLGLRLRKEKPVMLILISDDSGLPIYAKHFLNKGDTKPDETLVSGFLSAINSFVKEAFKVKGSIEHIKHEDYAIAFKKQESVMFCYVYDGPSHSASQKLNRFISYVLRSSAWKTIPAMVNLGRIDRNVILVLESWISEVFPTKEQDENQSKKEN